ncbi:MAG: hypothetical protein HYV60_25125, partial [Planctomycetia bacterium]|nr:hypothetical protein [Planctomycetia bacterium]
MFASWKKSWCRMHFSAASRRRLRRRRCLERLETRTLLATAEGTPFALGEVVDASNVVGALSASIDWSDGTVTAASVSRSGGGSLVGRVDYSLDTNNFFDSQLKKDLFQQAVDTVLAKLGDDLAAIMPSGRNSWVADLLHPGTGVSWTIANMQVAANEIVIFAGGRELGATLALGGQGGFQVSCIVPSFCDVVATRGEVGAKTGASAPPATDFGPWGGAISFDVTTDFYFSQSTTDLGTKQADFLSTAMHEVAHLLGFGTSPSWATYVSNGNYIGPASRIANGNQSVPLSSSGNHWADGTTSDGREAALDPSLTSGTRKLLTPLDFAGLDDVGWELVPITAAVNGSHTYADDGIYDVVVTVFGSSGGTMSKSLQETVINSPPTLTAAKNQSVDFGQPFTIADVGVFTDPGFGVNETFTYTIDWGDGSSLVSGVASIDALGSAGVATMGSYDGTHTYTNGGVYDVTLTVADDDGGTDSAQLRLTVASGFSLEVADGQISESDGPGATTLTVTRHSNDLSQPLAVALSTDASALDIPANVEIPAGKASVVLTVNAIDDDILNGTRDVIITATATGVVVGRATLIVVDHETLTLTVQAATVLESRGTAATLATVTRNNTNIDAALEVTISIDDETEAAAARSVIIPAGEKSLTFPIDAVEDGLDDGPQSVAITAAANGYAPGRDTFFVSDTLSWHNGTLRWDVNGDLQISPIDVLQII